MTTPDHDERHRELHQRVSDLLPVYRKRLLIPPRWKIDVRVQCPSEWCKEDYYAPLGSMAWEVLCNAHYRIRLNCEVNDDRLAWVVAHELGEAMLAPYGEFVRLNFMDKVRSKGRWEVLDEQHRNIRDELIEWMLEIIMPEVRPSISEAI